MEAIRLRKTIILSSLFITVKQLSDHKSSFYPSINDILYQKYLKKNQCYCDNVALYEATKTNKQKARISHFKSISGQQFCSISGLHTFGRKQRFLRFSTMHHGMYDSIYPKT